MARARLSSEAKEVRFRLSPTQLSYALSRAIITIIYGGMGGGKSYATAAAICAHAQRNKEERGLEEIRGCIVRDTLPNIKRSPVPTLQKAFGPLIRFKDEYRQATIFTDPIITLDCFGIADLGDLSKLQGPEYAFIWLVEPAPIADTERYSGGIPEEVFNIALARCARQEDAIPRLFVDMNPADEEHWTFRRLIEVPDGADDENPLITKLSYRLPVEENVHLSETAKQAVRVAYKGDLSSTARFVRGEFAPVYHGKKVVGAFTRDLHVAREILQPLRGFPGVRFWDSWGEPRCVIGQHLPDGQLRIYDVIKDHTDIEALIPKVKSTLNSPRYTQAHIYDWRDIGDFTMKQHDQSSRFTITSRKIEDAFDTFFEPGPNRFDTIKLALGEAFQRNTSRGDPCILICPSLKSLVAALSGRWHYKTDASGNVMKRIPEKNSACVDEETEILTLDGWKSYGDLNVGQPVYGYDIEKQALVYDAVQALNIYEDGPYEMLHFTTKDFDMMVTPDHRCVASRRIASRGPGGKFIERKTPYDIVLATKLNSAHHLLRTASLDWGVRIPKDREYSDEFIRLCAWVMTEGSYRKNPVDNIWLVQRKTHNAQFVEEIRALAQFFPTSMDEKSYGGPDNALWVINHELAKLMKILMPFKYPSPAFINQMTRSQIRLFLYEAIKGDGDWGPHQKNLPKIERNRDFWTEAKTPRIAASKSAEADAMQHMATIIGMRSSLKFKGDEKYRQQTNCWLVALTRRSNQTNVGKCKKAMVTVPMVWCPTTTTGTWVARRNGHVFITGNSHEADALANGISVIQPWQPAVQHTAAIKRLQAKQRKRANTYGQPRTVGAA